MRPAISCPVLRARGLAARTEGEVVRRRYTRVFNSLAARVRREADVSALDPGIPAPGQVFHYLVRGRNACPAGVGTLGFGSNGVERAGRICP